MVHSLLIHCRPSPLTRLNLAVAATGALLLAFTGPNRAMAQMDVIDPNHFGLRQEMPLLKVQGPSGPYRLELMVVRSAGAQGKLPIALITHGKPRNAAEMARVRGETMVREARDMAYRGYLAVAVVRRGYGQSDGTPGVASNAPYLQCNSASLQKYFEVEADDLEAVLKSIAIRPDADATRVIAIGGSVGGGVALALAARNPQGLLGVVSISGGVRLTNAEGQVACPYNHLAEAYGKLAVSTKVPSLWIYSQNDRTFDPSVVKMLHIAYLAAGGKASLRMIPPIGEDGHNAMHLADGRKHWLTQFDIFAVDNRLPTWSVEHTNLAMQLTKLPTKYRPFMAEYFSAYTPKVLVQAPNGNVSFNADTRSLFNARQSALEACQKAAGAQCRVVLENFAPPLGQ